VPRGLRSLGLQRFVAVSFIALVLGISPAGCRRESAAPARDDTSSKPAASDKPASAADDRAPQPPGAPATPPLPEDPAAGKRSEQQWREHMDHEEEERQTLFDRKRLKQHRALIKLIAAARARYDHARTEAAVAKVQQDMPRQVAEMRRRVTEIDPWGVNSRLLPDYAALTAALSDTYAPAKIAAIKGDASALTQLHADFDQRMKKMNDWLHEVEESKDE
jgi:hypothetical protein